MHIGPKTLPEALMSNKDMVHTHTVIHFRWPGRLLLLLTGRVEVITRVYTENEVGWTFTRETEIEQRPHWWRRFQNWRHRGPGGEVCLE